MKQAAVLLAPGFEEGEALTLADILRRAGFTCDLVGFSPMVEGAHGIQVQSDKLLSQVDREHPAYDMVILPGGIPGATNLRDSKEVMDLLHTANQEGKLIAAMCAAPIALEQAGLLEGKRFTAYVGYDQKIKAGTFCEDIVVRDGNILTSRGPATAYAFGYALVDALGGDSQAVKDRMVYTNAFKEGN